MKDRSENPIVCKACSLCQTLLGVRIKEKHDVTLTLYNENKPDEPECEHHMTGSSDHSVIKAIAVIGAISLVMTAFCAACSLLRE